MDLNSNASQIRTDGKYYHIWFPSIVGICESVFYQHAGSHIKNKIEQIQSLDLSQIHSDTDIWLLMSRVFWYTFVRCLDFDKPYRSDLIILSHGEIHTFNVRGNHYYIILYTDIHGKIQYFTNFSANSLFFSWFEDGIFTLYNRGLGSIVFQKHYTSPEGLPSTTREANWDNYTIWITGDAIEWDIETTKISELLKVLESILSVKKSEKSSFVEISASYRDELVKLGWILWTHQVVFWDGSLWGFLTRDDITGFRVEDVREFSLSGSINIFDEWWYIMRKNILSLTHLLDTLRIQRDVLDGAIDEIDSLQSIHLELQKKRSTMTLEDIKDSITIVENQLHLLIELGKNRIS